VRFISYTTIQQVTCIKTSEHEVIKLSKATRSEKMTEKKANAVPSTLVDAFRETNQAIAETIVAAQERNIQFAQSTLVSAMEIFKNHMESTRALMQELEQQAQKQLEAFQQLGHGPENPPEDFLRAPFSYYQQVLATTEKAYYRESHPAGIRGFSESDRGLSESSRTGTREL
jgi:guanyl-specific ribonuclease Sa